MIKLIIAVHRMHLNWVYESDKMTGRALFDIKFDDEITASCLEILIERDAIVMEYELVEKRKH